jgi:hypothetical protein
MTAIDTIQENDVCSSVPNGEDGGNDGTASHTNDTSTRNHHNGSKVVTTHTTARMLTLSIRPSSCRVGRGHRTVSLKKPFW